MAKIKIPSDVRREVYNQEVQRTVNKKAIYELANSQLNGMQAVGIWGERKYFPDEDYIFDGKHLKILPVLLLRKGKKEGETIKCRSGFYAVFDVTKMGCKSWELRKLMLLHSNSREQEWRGIINPRHFHTI